MIISLMRVCAYLLGCFLISVLIGCGSSGSSGSVKTTEPPVANAGGPYSGMPGVALNFSGSKSTDPQGEALVYGWSFGDGTTGTGMNPTHTYSQAGTYNVSLTVTDTSNLTSTGSAVATITADPPLTAFITIVLRSPGDLAVCAWLDEDIASAAPTVSARTRFFMLRSLNRASNS